ncbi:ATP-dependent DNA helicase RecQ-like [Ostrea edulis]|uniref:ATP-dependent DNA helicase RecQ-like n=1 Tax=Ostrea edulis TaxID=37623 RepID=UPI0024AFFB5A|nr:ATP-dependent DNA helicase RecQ-like [Ostrea edulis]
MRKLTSERMAASIDQQTNAICDRFKIQSLTEKQYKTITAIENGKDVFTSTKTGSGKSLSYEYFPVLHPGKCVLIIAPLISIMKEQCEKLQNMGFKASYIGKDLQDTDLLEQGLYDFVFGSPEVFLNNSKWRTMLKSDIYQIKLQLIAVDEAHTVTQWGEGDKEEEPFREAFAHIGELRSLCPKASLLALTATSGPSQRRKIMKMLCFSANSEVILDSPDRENIKLTSLCIPNSDNLEKVFHWLIDILKTQKAKAERHIIFCESIADVSKIYTTFVKHFGNDCQHFEMFHSKTDEKVKEIISKDMNVDGNIRVLICTNAAGMGVNFHNVHHVIHYKLPRKLDTFVQQMGRVGRDGQFSDELILYKTNNNHLKKVEIEMVRLAKDDSKCRHEILCEAYLLPSKKILPLHDCCDVCESKCECKSDLCPRTHEGVRIKNEDNSSSDLEDEMTRFVNDRKKQLIHDNLLFYKSQMPTADCIVKFEVLHGLTNEVIQKIVTNSNSIFTPDDVMRKYPIWSMDTATAVSEIISDVVGDLDMYNLAEDSEVESD